MSLTDTLHEVISKKLDNNLLVLMLLALKFEQRGVKLTAEQKTDLKKQISEQIQQNDKDTFTLQLDGWEEIIDTNLVITNDDYKLLEERVDKAIEGTVLAVISNASEDIVNQWKDQATHVLDEERNDQEAFNEHIQSIWGKALDLLDILIGTSTAVGFTFNPKKRPQSSQNYDIVFEVLTRLHARGCQVAREIHVLLSNGLADGAHARWRTLHEISVIASFIRKHGPTVAERYLLHVGIERYKAALQYQEYHQALGESPFEAEEMKELKSEHDALVKEFGKDFKHDYGWASDVLGKRKPTFYDIEQNAGLEHIRPFVKMSSMNIHASASGLVHRLGLLSGMDLLLAGHSIYGLGDPGRNCAASLTVLMVALLLSKPDLENLIVTHAIQHLKQEIHHAFYEAEIAINENNQ